LIFGGERCQRERHTRTRRAGDDLGVRTDQIFRGGDRLRRIAGIVAFGNDEFVAAGHAGTVRRVVETDCETLGILRAVSGKEAGFGIDQADGNGRGVGGARGTWRRPRRGEPRHDRGRGKRRNDRCFFHTTSS
jgi:hypothetical protein